MLEKACTSASFLSGLISTAIHEIEAFVESHGVAVGAGVAAVAAAGGGGLLGLLGPLALAALALKGLLDALGADDRLGEAMEKIKNKLLDPNEPDPAKRAAGLFAWQLIAYAVFQELQKDQEAAALSYAIMEGHDYLDVSCQHNVASVEVFFDANDSRLIAFVDALIAYETKQEFLGRACVGYASLRFTGRTRALIGPARWERSAVVEVAVLKDINGSQELIDHAVKLARSGTYNAILHWGQRNDCNRGEIEARFGDDLRRWRDALATVTGGRDGFSSAFTRQTGLEP